MADYYIRTVETPALACLVRQDSLSCPREALYIPRAMVDTVSRLVQISIFIWREDNGEGLYKRSA
ncbi:hypothetical protein GCM10007971_36950 [Oceanobacillus indicireducens]|uniref:Uncharacterized protein n=1 Tax=Oceanobacillus indicireducens TaxID=1004261 RepID=A0A917Y3R7_9BACI|nr:hypothetical protein GCM10007971_36950 [Oceanobacillus indicireducens]